jgi:hypothetical protein
MTVKELMIEFAKYDPEKPVLMALQVGDEIEYVPFEVFESSDETSILIDVVESEGEPDAA